MARIRSSDAALLRICIRMHKYAVLRLEELGTQHFNYHLSKLILGFRPAFLILSSEQMLYILSSLKQVNMLPK